MSEPYVLDPNFLVKTGITREHVRVYSILEPPFRVHGLLMPNEVHPYLHRLPEAAAEKVSPGIHSRFRQTTGGRVRFKTDSAYIAIVVKLHSLNVLSHMALTGIAGFDLYRTQDGKQRYIHTYIPPKDLEATLRYSSELELPEGTMQEYTLNFPVYSGVEELHILLDADAQVLPADPYRNELPVVFYGSSITQGGCASRPGNQYINVLSRRLNMDYVNLGFSGQAKGEPAMAEYISTLKMRAFVFDYDYNAVTPEDLLATHEPFFKIIRAAHPDLPIICPSKIYPKRANDPLRRQIIHQTVLNAQAAGDKNVYYIDGLHFQEVLDVGDGVTTDGVHPNDLGFFCMAYVMEPLLRQILDEE